MGLTVHLVGTGFGPVADIGKSTHPPRTTDEQLGIIDK
jgi:hypothetical protein